MRPAVKRFWIAFPIVFAVMALAVLPLCGLMFQCGCTILTGDAHCNMHDRGVPHCPWCTGGIALQGSHFGAMLWAAVLGTVYGARRGAVWKGAVGGVAAFAAVAIIGGLFVCLATGYPVWFGIRLK